MTLSNLINRRNARLARAATRSGMGLYDIRQRAIRLARLHLLEIATS